ncbi:MAG: tRNA (5-methylaminomethyl-2-thiouridine)(34)-methyltransferase MnmD [Pseudomonadales bacterium]
MAEPPPGPAPADADPVLPAARIRYAADQPYSLDFSDIYHAADGAAEVQRVFLGPCGIAELAAERGSGRWPVRIGELGFGSGLNFAVAAQRCLDAGARLHFLSVEAAPLDAADFAVIARARAAAHPIYAELADRYPPRLRGWHRRWLADGRICLSLWWGDAAAGLADLADRQRQPMDAWFLDGFAPDRNPAMWDDALLARLPALSRPGTRVATFTAAGRVRRGLTAAGFAMRRVDQRPHKRETLAGTLTEGGSRGFEPPARVDVAGAGLAGASLAWHLARAGHAVRVWDGGPSAGPPAGSALPVTVLHGRLLADGSAAAGLRSHGYLYAADLVRTLAGFEPTGVLQRPAAGQGPDRLATLAARYAGSGSWLRLVSAEEARELAGWPLAEGCLWLPGGGRVDTPAMTAGLLSHPGIEVVPEAMPAAMPAAMPEGTDAGCRVLACGAGVHAFAAARYLEIAPVQGQIDLVAVAQPPALPLVGNGYLVPAGTLVPAGALLAAGATYEYEPWPEAEASTANLAQLQGHPHTWQGRHRGTRAVSSDRAPVAGQLYDAAERPVPGLYVSTGHGSSGNVSAHLAAACVTALIGGDCPPLDTAAEAALSPLRFRTRQARRGFRHGAGD